MLEKQLTEKYRRLRMMNRLRLPISRPDTNYGKHPSEPDIDENELKQLCCDYFKRLQLSPEQSQHIANSTCEQANEVNQLWEAQRKRIITSSKFGEVSKRKKPFAPLTRRLIYDKLRENKAMRYGNQNESKARNDYTEYISIHFSMCKC